MCIFIVIFVMADEQPTNMHKHACECRGICYFIVMKMSTLLPTCVERRQENVCSLQYGITSVRLSFLVESLRAIKH